MAAHGNVLQRINNQLADGLEAKLTQDGRIYYISHHTQTTSWLPPRENWDPGSGLPYGWELAVDRSEKPYFINHVEKYTTREDPRDDPDYVEPPTPRDVELIRDPNKGFGFVAGSEKPVIVRFVTEGGPSVDKLLPADQIIKINGEDVKRAPREYVIDLVRSCKHSIKLTVCQPYVDNSSRKSALLTAAKKARLKSNPSRVRFADSVVVNGASVHGPSAQESYVPLMPNVLKVFLENGQTKSFKYDNKTTVKDVLDSMQEKLNIKRIEHFALVLQNTKSSSHGKLSILQEQETLAEIAARPGAMHFRCLFRVTFVPKDAYDLLREDTIAFEYFYMQCCNDVVQERFAAELKYDTALRLAALQIQQHVMSSNLNNKISLKTVERDCGLERFVPPSLLDSMKGKDVRKMIQQYLKMNQSLSAPGQKQLTALQAKLHYLKIISELKTFGSRIFMVTLLDKRAEGMVLVGPKSGISLITNIKSYATALLTDFDDIESITISKEGESMYRVEITLSDENLEHICLGLLYEDMNNFLALVEGYHRIFVEDSTSLLLNIPYKTQTPDVDIPPYEGQHKVIASTWSYPEDIVSQVISPANEVLSDNVCEDERIVDLSAPPPEYISNGTKLAIKNDQTETISSEDSTSTDASSVLSKDSQEDVVHNNLQAVTLRNKLSNFDEGVTSFGRESSSSEPEIESLIEVHVNKNGVDSSESDSISENSQVLVEEGNLKTFTRYVPSPIASLNKRRKHTNLDRSESEVSLPEDVLCVSVENSRFHLDTLSGQEVDSNASDADTDSVFGPETERKPLLLSHNAADDGDGVGEYRNSHVVRLESDDTDSWEETPEGSPAKNLESTPRPSSASTKLNLGDLPQSFGLHSPDQLPMSEQDYHKMATSFGLHSPDQIPPDMYSAVYDPRLFCDGGLYLDPDIIDLTLIPPPKTPDDDLVIDFSSMANPPPPGFMDNGSLSPGTSCSRGKKPLMSKQELEKQFELLCRLDDDKEQIGTRLSDCVFTEDESDSGNETISSENIELTNGLAENLGHEPADLVASHQQRVSNRTLGAAPGGTPKLNSFRVNPLSELNTDIDDLIARLTVPPPPSTGNTTTTEQKIKSYKRQKQKSKHSSWSPADCPLSPSINELSLEEEIAALIIPPPPSSPALIDIPIVPPVTPDNSHHAGGKMKKLSPHKRSSSVDLSLLRKHSSDKTLESSVEHGQGSKFKGKAPQPPENFKMDRRHMSADDVNIGTAAHVEVESPSTVSERLNSLLKSIPFEIQDEEKTHSSLMKTWSHRERKDSGQSSQTSGHANGSGKIARSSSLRVRRSPSPQLNNNIRQLSMSSERLRSNSSNGESSLTPSRQFVPKSILKTRSVETVQHCENSKGSGDSNGKSDTFAALKAKLQEYRDIMLRRRNGGAKSAQESSSVKGDKAGAKGQSKGSSLRRSSSLSEQSCINMSSTRDNQKVSKRSSPRKQQSLSLNRSPFTSNNWSANENDREEEEENHSENNVNSEDKWDKKKAPMKPLFNTLPVNFNKLSLRALAGNSNAQEIDGDHSVVEQLPATESLQVNQ
ncbi:uncharacterized protein LOC135473057 isoform X2 [Liolophura sinensis]|uniref:uncharacterized protein LOC135473057 isoform X2 n=1 Tax=Liolophura sinensis TaxID=3198878 RepID=UPI00315938DB